MSPPFSFRPQTPVSFLERSALVHAGRTAVVDGDLRLTYAELWARSRALTGVLAGLGVAPGDRVAALCVNSHVMLELHHGVPMAGAVLVPLNIRLSVPELVYMLEHSGAKVLLTTPELAGRAQEAGVAAKVRVVVAEGPGSEYETLRAAAEPRLVPVTDERALLAINYTSGTTGRPKGVMYCHRGAFQQALAMAFHTRMAADSRYLWTLPMFHCNGWCFTWAVGAAGATHVALRAVEPERIWQLLREEGITHLSGAPTVLTMIAGAPAAAGEPLSRPVQVQTGGAPPTPTLLRDMARLRMNVTHLYGLTETYGPLAINDLPPEAKDLPEDEFAALNARQGVGNVVAERVRVIGPSGADVPNDAATIGEIVARGDNVMLGYYRDDAATEAVTTEDGWMRTGDLAVVHPDGYVEIRDRSKDVIISGGENIASVEVEQVLAAHPAVLEVAVVAAPDEKWGQVPVAYVTLRTGSDVTADELRAHVRERLAGFKVPRRVVFGDLPKTSTGKIRKNELREGVDSGRSTLEGHRY